MIDPYEVLIVLNDLEPMDFDKLEFAVITEPAAQRFDVGTQEFVNEPWWFPFDRAEVIVLHKDSGREPFGEGRKPGKWGVTCERFPTFAEAMQRRAEVLASVPAADRG